MAELKRTKTGEGLEDMRASSIKESMEFFTRDTKSVRKTLIIDHEEAE
jgi:hypothetical protein